MCEKSLEYNYEIQWTRVGCLRVWITNPNIYEMGCYSLSCHHAGTKLSNQRIQKLTNDLSSLDVDQLINL